MFRFNCFFLSWALGQSCKDQDGVLNLIINNKQAKCLDGSPPGYYVSKGRDIGLKKWFVHFEGGGWCPNYENCLKRSTTALGSSKQYSQCLPSSSMKHYQSGLKNANPMMFNWNRVIVKYCDGSSYASSTIVDYKVHIACF